MDYFDVLFAKTNGVSSSTCYNEIEAMLEATVGHSNKNLFEPKYRQGTSANTTTETAVCSLTVIPTEYGKTHIFRKYNNNFSIRIYGTNNEGKEAILSGGVLTQSLRLYESGYIYDESWTHTNETQGVTCYVIMVRKPNFPLAEPVTYQDITPTDIPSNLVMVTDISIPDNTFEPYVTPTDEKKQDKPVVLWEAALNSSGVSDVPISSLDNLANYSYLKVVITNELGTTITDEDAIQANVEYNPSYIGRDVGASTGILGFHEVDEHLVFDRLFVWVISDGINISVVGLRDYNDTSNPPDVVPGVFIRKIIGIPK